MTGDGESKHGIVGPVDLEALALHVVKLSGALERAWSDALDSGVLNRAEDELNTELGALVTAMTGALQETDERLEAEGVDPKIYSWPYDPDTFKKLQPGKDAASRRGNLVIAQMIALREVLEAYRALQEPSGEEIDLVARSRTQWFEAGAFALFRDRAKLLLRVTREVDRVADALLGEAAPPTLDLSIEAADESLRAAQAAYSHGDLDAAILHSRSALRGALESLPFIESGDPRLSEPGALLSRAPSLSEYASGLCLLDDEANALSSRSVDLGLAVPLIDGLLPVIAAIVHEPPIVELQDIFSTESSGS
ncbi:MAG TPA: hypothetical protein VNM38_00520 [Solirubrobacterales bacterium]|nr:hypothetical protein [Solirubrobacterales bacterium]